MVTSTPHKVDASASTSNRLKGRLESHEGADSPNEALTPASKAGDTPGGQERPPSTKRKRANRKRGRGKKKKRGLTLDVEKEKEEGEASDDDDDDKEDGDGDKGGEEVALDAMITIDKVGMTPEPTRPVFTVKPAILKPVKAATSLAAAFLATLRAQEMQGGIDAVPAVMKTPKGKGQAVVSTPIQPIPEPESTMETNNATPLYKNGDEELGDEYYIWGAEHIPEHLVKYWYQRYNLFSKYDEGIMLDEESWFSVTPEKVAEYQAQRLACDTIIDGFCGAGGNAIQFAKTCKKVIAIDIDPTKLRCARNNARIYGVEDKIEFVLGDVLEVLKGRTADTIFLSPPWGGPEYLQADAYDIHTMLPIDATTLFETARAVTPNVCMFMPRNVISQQLADLAGPGGVCEVEEEFLNGRSKAIVAYYGGLVGDGVAEEEEEVEVEEE